MDVWMDEGNLLWGRGGNEEVSLDCELVRQGKYIMYFYVL